MKKYIKLATGHKSFYDSISVIYLTGDSIVEVEENVNIAEALWQGKIVEVSKEEYEQSLLQEENSTSVLAIYAGLDNTWRIIPEPDSLVIEKKVGDEWFSEQVIFM